MTERVGKLVIATQQLEAGIRLLFKNAPFAPTHTLLFAASEVLKNLCDHEGKKSNLDQSFEDWIKPDHRKDVHHLFRRHALFFKHAEQDPQAEIELPDPRVNDFLALRACFRHRALGQQFTPTMEVLTGWVLWTNPTMAKEAPNPVVAKIQDMLQGFSRAERLMFGRLRLAMALGDQRTLTRVVEDFADRFPDAWHRACVAVSEGLQAMGLPAEPPPPKPHSFRIPSQ